jgi:hypothetical protein
MRVVDGQYRKYKVLETAQIRSGEGGLDAQAVSNAIRDSAPSDMQFAAGADAEFRTLALTGWPVERLLTDQEIARKAMRGLGRDEIQTVKASVADYIFSQASVTNDLEITPLVSGTNLLRQVSQNRDGLKRLGFTETDLTRMQDIGNRLTIIQARPADSPVVVDDELTLMAKVAASMTGVRAASAIADATGVTGPGTLVLAGRVSGATNRKLQELTAGQKNKLLADAAVNGELYRALLLRNSSTARQVRDAESALNAWFIATGVGTATDFPEETREALAAGTARAQGIAAQAPATSPQGMMQAVPEQGMFRQPSGAITPGFEPPMQ